jgi:hypothetical protein
MDETSEGVRVDLLGTLRVIVGSEVFDRPRRRDLLGPCQRRVRLRTGCSLEGQDDLIPQLPQKGGCLGIHGAMLGRGLPCWTAVSAVKRSTWSAWTTWRCACCAWPVDRRFGFHGSRP